MTFDHGLLLYWMLAGFCTYTSYRNDVRKGPITDPEEPLDFIILMLIGGPAFPAFLWREIKNAFL